MPLNGWVRPPCLPALRPPVSLLLFFPLENEEAIICVWPTLAVEFGRTNCLIGSIPAQLEIVTFKQVDSWNCLPLCHQVEVLGFFGGIELVGSFILVDGEHDLGGGDDDLSFELLSSNFFPIPFDGYEVPVPLNVVLIPCLFAAANRGSSQRSECENNYPSRFHGDLPSRKPLNPT